VQREPVMESSFPSPLDYQLGNDQGQG